MKKKLFTLALAFLTVCLLSVSAFAADTDVYFSANVTITTEEERISVAVANSDALEAKRPRLTVSCDFDEAYVTLEEVIVPSTLDTDKDTIKFEVSVGGDYVIHSGAAPSSDPGSDPGTDPTPVTPPSTPDTPADPVTGSEARPAATVENGEAKAELSTEVMDSVIENAKADAAETVTIAPEISGDADKVAVELPKASVSDMAEQTGAALVIETELGSVSISNEALASIAQQAEGDGIVIEITEVTAADAESEAAISEQFSAGELDSAVIVEVTVSSSGKQITDFGGAAITLELPVSEAHEEGKTYLVLAISDDGSVSRMTGRVVNGKLLVTTTHLTTFVATSEAVSPFVDVAADAYYYDAVLWAAAQEITSGTGDGTTFSPADNCTRAQIVTFLWRAAGAPMAATANPFTDVAEGAYYYDAVIWAAENSITEGTSDTTFSPDAIVTRGEFVTFLYRFADKPAVSGEMKFSDVADGAFYYDAVLWAAENGVTEGVSETAFGPADTCTRGQTVTFLHRYLVK